MDDEARASAELMMNGAVVQSPYHLEFTRRASDPVLGTRTDEDLIVFYFGDSKTLIGHELLSL